MKKFLLLFLILKITFIKPADSHKNGISTALLQESELNKVYMIKYLVSKNKSQDKAEDYFILLPNDFIKSYLYFISGEKCVSVAKEIYDSLSDKYKSEQANKAWVVV